MEDLSIISLNVNGLREQRKRWLLFNFLHHSKFDIALLQETHACSRDDAVLWNRESGYKGYWSFGTTTSCGVGILVREGLNLERCSYRYDYAGRVALLEFSYLEQDFRLVNLYVPTDGSHRIEFLQSLDCYLVTRRRLLVGGDFNCLLDLSKDNFGGNPSLGDTGASHLKTLLSRYRLVDIWRKQHELAREFTWRNKSGTIRCRLDRFYVSSSLVNDCAIESSIIPYLHSDHDIVHLQLRLSDSGHRVGPGIWKLNTSLLSHQSVRDKVSRFWMDWRKKKSQFGNVGEWWDAGKARIKSLLISCSRKIAKSANQDRACLMNRYHSLLGQASLSDSDIKRLDDVKAQLVDMDNRRVQGHQLRSQAKWVETNERASKFFFHKETKRAVKKTCVALKTKDGQRVTDQSDIMQEQVRFYKELYSAVPTDRGAQDRLLDLLDRKLSDEQSNSCEGDLLEGECLAALKTLRNGKTPGSDGLPKEFYMCFWELLKDDLLEMLNNCLSDGVMPDTLRQAIITLLFKKNDPEYLKNWRPISLLNVDYKILTKVLVNRVKPVMSSVVDSDQCCSVPGRSSEDNATILRDITDYLEVHERQACAFLSMDQEKAFDYVDWDFLGRVLAKMNFGPKLRAMIKCIYTDIQSAILSNGYVSPSFQVARGVRQGCPLSPLLFVLVAEVFGQAIRKSSEISGFRIPGGREVKISQYADDNTCIVTNSYGILKVIDIFHEYGRASGARLNTSKTHGL
jgi:exonuclease III